MRRESIGFGGGATQTIIHPAILAGMLLAIVLLLLLPRRLAIVPFLLITILTPGAQQLYLAGVHWYVPRIVVLAGCMRLAAAKFRIAGGWNGIDRVFLAWAICRGMAVILLNGSGAAAVNQAAFWLDGLGGYFLLRYLIRDEADIRRAARVFAIMAAIVGACMVVETVRGVNVFAYLGGTPAFEERNGYIRAQGPFRHPILAGSFGATLVPLFYWLWRSGRDKVLAAAGIAGAAAMALATQSSTPVMALGAGAGALFLWPMRREMRAVRWGIVLAIAGLAAVMKAPVWFVIQHVNVIGGSGGYDRAMLVDNFIRHFQDWWLIGSNKFAGWGFNMWDLSNQFVAEGEVGGLATFVLFLAIITRSYSRLGRMRKRVARKEEWLYWCLGAVMLAHIFAFFGVSYWDQTQIWWFAFLAMISAATLALEQPASRAESDEDAVDESGAEGEAQPAGSAVGLGGGA